MISRCALLLPGFSERNMIMKRILCCILIVMLLSCDFTAFASASPAVSIVCPDGVVSEEVFDVYVNISDNSNVGGGRITFGYDSSVLEILSVTAGELLNGATMLINTAYTDSTARVSWACVSNLTTGGNLLKISFKAKTIYENANTAIYISNMKLTDADTNIISGTAINGELLVERKVVPSFSVECVDEVLIGTNIDVNINISENSLACGGRFNLEYDNEKFEVVSAQGEDILSETTPLINLHYSDNTVRASWAGATALTDGGCLLTITFRVFESASGCAEFILNNCKMTDSNDVAIQCLATNKSVEIVSELICSTKTVYVEENGMWKFASSIKNCPQDSVIIVALYDEYKVVNSAIINISNDTSIDTYIEKCDFDTAKVFVWESSKNAKPISVVEKIEYK